MNYFQIVLYLVIIPSTLVLFIASFIPIFNKFSKRNRLILLVDDDPYLLSGLGEALQGNGYRVRTAKNINDVRNIMADISDSNKLFYAVIDLQLQNNQKDKYVKFQGIEIINILHEKFPSTKIIPLSGHDYKEIEMEFNTPMTDGKKISNGLIKLIKNNFINKSESYKILHMFNQ
jgi:CheY-like chemotaxis protein